MLTFFCAGVVTGDLWIGTSGEWRRRAAAREGTSFVLVRAACVRASVIVMLHPPIHVPAVLCCVEVVGALGLPLFHCFATTVCCVWVGRSQLAIAGRESAASPRDVTVCPTGRRGKEEHCVNAFTFLRRRIHFCCCVLCVFFFDWSFSDRASRPSFLCFRRCAHPHPRPLHRAKGQVQRLPACPPPASCSAWSRKSAGRL